MMRTVSSELQQARAQLINVDVREPWDHLALAEHLERLTKLFERTSRDQHRVMISEFHNCAGRLPYVVDRDVGALILEAAADIAADAELQTLFYSEARVRATWCAQGATSGGEGMARAQHLRELDEKIREAVGRAGVAVA